jgi:hypothetical protein
VSVSAGFKDMAMLVLGVKAMAMSVLGGGYGYVVLVLDVRRGYIGAGR